MTSIYLFTLKNVLNTLFLIMIIMITLTPLDVWSKLMVDGSLINGIPHSFNEFNRSMVELLNQHIQHNGSNKGGRIILIII